jgi:ATP-dependent DNA ligase
MTLKKSALKKYFGESARASSTWTTSKVMRRLLFDQIVKMDLEGITWKQRDSPYRATEQQSRYRIKVKNSHHSRLD